MSAEKKWTRPESVPHPSVWRRFEGAKPLPNGQILKFRIQDFTEDLRQQLIDHMSEHFLRDEPTCENQNLIAEPLAVQEVQAYWNEFLSHKLALVCLLENKEELEDKTLPVFAGCNVTALSTPQDSKEKKLQSVAGVRVFRLLDEVSSRLDCFKHYGVSEYLYALGLSVHPAYRGQGIGLELLKARFDLGRAVGIKLTVTVFTAIASQKLAERTGFETLVEVDYDDVKENGEVLFKGMKTKSVKLMAARIT